MKTAVEAAENRQNCPTDDNEWKQSPKTGKTMIQTTQILWLQEGPRTMGFWLLHLAPIQILLLFVFPLLAFALLGFDLAVDEPHPLLEQL